MKTFDNHHPLNDPIHRPSIHPSTVKNLMACANAWKVANAAAATSPAELGFEAPWKAMGMMGWWDDGMESHTLKNL